MYKHVHGLVLCEKKKHENKFSENQETELWLANGGQVKEVFSHKEGKTVQ